jgi:hypothetical protein
MPEHVHLLVYPNESEPDLGLYLARVKQPLSTFVKGCLVAEESTLLSRLTVQERPSKTCFRFWQEGAGIRSKSIRSCGFIQFSQLYPFESRPPRTLHARHEMGLVLRSVLFGGAT